MILAECNSCGLGFELPQKFAGKHGKCPRCGEVVKIPKNKPPTDVRPGKKIAKTSTSAVAKIKDSQIFPDDFFAPTVLEQPSNASFDPNAKADEAASHHATYNQTVSNHYHQAPQQPESTSEVTTVHRFCQYCSKPVHEKAKICPGCGCEIGRPEETNSTPSPELGCALAILTVFIPIVGIGGGLYYLSKNQSERGVALLLWSILWIVVGYLLLTLPL